MKAAPKFKAGDEVVFPNIPTLGTVTIIEQRTYFKEEAYWLIVTRNEVPCREWDYAHSLEFEYVINSPLYKALE